jgi:hypothetical protein
MSMPRFRRGVYGLRTAERRRDVGDAGAAARRDAAVGERRVPIVRAARDELPRPEIVFAEVQLRHEVLRRDAASHASVLPTHINVRVRPDDRRGWAEQRNRFIRDGIKRSAV